MAITPIGEGEKGAWLCSLLTRPLRVPETHIMRRCRRLIGGNQERAIMNIKACLEAAGSSLDKVVRRRIYIIDMKQFRKVDEIWGKWFSEPYPGKSCPFLLSGLLCGG